MNKEITFKYIGRIKTPFKTREELKFPPFMKEAPYHDPNIHGVLQLDEEFKEGIRDLKPGSSAMVLFHFDRSDGYSLITNSPSFDGPVGVFSTRSPNRPNGIGVTIINIISVSDREILFQGVDMLDDTPLLDIKPFGNKK